MQLVPQIENKKVRLDGELLNKIKKVRAKSLLNKTIYASDKQFVEIAVIKLLKKEEKK